MGSRTATVVVSFLRGMIDAHGFLFFACGRTFRVVVQEIDHPRKFRFNKPDADEDKMRCSA